MNVSLFVGEITKAQAEVVSASTNPKLELMPGAGGAARDLGGWPIQEQCGAIIANEHARSRHRRRG